jgi:UTP--glucose-1-phosphate uridylyltransferase
MAAIRKAIIPVAGKGTRLRPVTWAIPKAMFPLADGHGGVRTVLEWILDEAAAAGIEQTALVVSGDQLAMIGDYLKRTGRRDRVELIVQETPAGFGHAVALAEHFADGEPILLFLGDHVHLADSHASPCAAQVARAFASVEASAVIGVQPVGEQELSRVGVVAGSELADQDDSRLQRCREFIEKPDRETARERLTTPGLEEGTYLAHCGIYAFGPEIFDVLARLSDNRTSGRELQLAQAQASLLQLDPQRYYLYRIAGLSLDTGTPDGLAHTQATLWARAAGERGQRPRKRVSRT